MKYTVWLRTAAVFQFITALVHGIGLFLDRAPNNETEKQLEELMSTYRMDLAGMHPTMGDLFLALSSCFSLVYLLGGLMNWFLAGKNLHLDVMRGVININLIVFTISFGLMVAYTFPPPIILTGLVFIFLVIARIRVGKA